MEKVVKKFNLDVTFLDYAYIIGGKKIRRNSSYNARIYVLYFIWSFIVYITWSI